MSPHPEEAQLIEGSNAVEGPHYQKMGGIWRRQGIMSTREQWRANLFLCGPISKVALKKWREWNKDQIGY